MHTKHYFSILTMAGLLSSAALTGCVDQDYSLDDIDMEMQFQFNDLTLPLNLAPVKLSTFVDLSEQDNVEIVNGEYALVRTEEFSSSDIHIQAFLAQQSEVNQSKTTIDLPKVVPNVEAPLPGYVHQFNYDYNDVDKHIIDITSGTVDMNFSITISTQFKDGDVLNAQFRDLKFVLPKGFYGTLSTGQTIGKNSSNIVSISSAKVDANGEFKFNFHVTEFDRIAAGGSMYPEQNRFTLATSMGIESGYISYTNGPTGAAVIGVDVEISPLEILTINGKVGYEMTEWDTKVMFDNLPTVLTSSETNISLYNPQLYLTLTNPLGTSAHALTGVEIRQIRDVVSDEELAKLNELEVKSIVEPQKYCLLPHPDKVVAYPGYEDAEPVKMVNLGNIVAGNGFPKGLSVNFVKPGFPEQIVTDFPLNFDGRIGGKYTLFAPIQLGDGSSIYYSERTDGWDLSTDSEEMDIEKLILEADVTSHLPVNVFFSAIPVNSEGQEIQNIKINKVEIPAGQTHHVVITMEGNVTDLDGMDYTAKLVSPADAKVLTPDSYLDVNNLKIRVTGNYIIKEDSDDED